MNDEIKKTPNEISGEATEDAEHNQIDAEQDRHDSPKGERIAKMLARAGVGSRRAVERMIEAGMVKQGDKIIVTPATLISSVEGITVGGMVVKPPEPTKLWKYYKPAGRVTTYFDPEGRPTVFEAMPSNMPRVLAIGRLDLNTEGLLLMTNDGELARWLELPATGWLRTYKVRCHGYFDREKVDQIRRGITIEGVKYRGVQININENREKSNIWLTIGIKEGKNREVRKLLDYIGLQVTRLIRLSYGPFELEKMAKGDISEVRVKDMRLFCADYFKDHDTTDGITTEGVDNTANQSREGWAKSKPKTNQRRINKKKNDPKRLDAKAKNSFKMRAKEGAKPGFKSPSKSPSKSGSKFDKPSKSSNTSGKK